MHIFLKPKTLSFTLPAIILFFGFIVRLYRFDNPIADWHSWRQSDTSAVSRIFVERGFDLLHPRYLDISNIQTGKNNPEGYRYVEFPIYNFFQGAFFKTVGIFTLEEWGRLVSIFSSLGAGFFLFQLIKKHYDFKVGILSLFFYMFLPFSIYYSRTILPDIMMVGSCLGGIYFFDIYLDRKKNDKLLFLFLSTLFTATSFLLKPYALFFALPQVYLAYKKYNLKMLLKPALWMHLVLSVIPLAWWRMFIMQYPEGIPASNWLFNGNGIRFRPSFFKWIFYERITKLISGYFGVAFLATGFVVSIKQKLNFLALSFLVSSLLYVCIIATGNVQHDYYQILIMPTIALFMGLGASYFTKKGNAMRIVGILIILLSFYFGWSMVKDYFNINNRSIIIVGKKADGLLPKNAKVIVPYDGDTTPLYYINRPGWPAFQDSVGNLKKLGATHLIFVKPLKRDIDSFGKQYEVVAQSPDYLIIKL